MAAATGASKTSSSMTLPNPDSVQMAVQRAERCLHRELSLAQTVGLRQQLGLPGDHHAAQARVQDPDALLQLLRLCLLPAYRVASYH